MATSIVHVRLDGKLKDQASKALESMGMSISDAVRLMLIRVATEKVLPFEVSIPNAVTVRAMCAADKKKGKRYSSTIGLYEDLGV